ncbi:thioredoxin domain-containing protein [Nocardioides sp. W7]|uniref:DsbA family protein n=1 Tax=Nocardioides sp. W7 TaxID=2931390 RepID=UPI001FD06A02|nr:thioredoxin domain-containing protein [Nocardioides sp. W7]
MSKKSAQTSRTERAAAAVREQQREEARRRNLMVGGVVGVLVVALVAGFLWMRANDTSDDVTAPAAGSEYGLTIGPDGAPREVIIYEDFHCVHCADLEERTREDLARFAEAGDVRVEFRTVSFLTDYSMRAANAFKVVLEEAGPEVAKRYHDLLFQNYDKASGSEDGLDDDTLVSLAVDAGAEEDAVRPGIEDLAQREWVDSATQAAQDAGVRGTPTVLLDGEPVSGSTEDIANSLVEALG